MTKTFFDGIDGKAFVDNVDRPKFSCILINTWCFINGECNNEIAIEFFENLPKTYKVINAGGEWEKYCIKFYKDRIEKYTRFCTRDNQKFNIDKLQEFIDCLNKKYILKKIDGEIYDKIQNTDSFCTKLSMSKNYEQNGIGFVCMEKNIIVAVITSDLVYKNAVELNIKVNPDKRREGIGSALYAIFILECIKKKIYPVVDAANLNGLYLALKAGYEKESEYNVYLIVK